MSESGHLYPTDDPLYHRIHDLCLIQTQFDEIWFGPLLGKFPGVFSVAGTLMNPREDGTEAIVTVWRGQKEGRDVGREPPRLWLLIRIDSDHGILHEQTVPLESEPGAEFEIPDFAANYPVAEAGRTLLEMFVTAEPSHRGLTGSARTKSYDQLNGAVETGMDEAAELGDDFDEEDEGNEELLHALCTGSNFETISFGLMPSEGSAGLEKFCTVAALPLGTRVVQMNAWLERVEDDYRLMLEIDGTRQIMPAEGAEQKISWPGTAKTDRKAVERAVASLRPIHLEAYGRFASRVTRAKFETCAGLEAVAMNALNGGEPFSLDDLAMEDGHDPGRVGSSWHEELQEFIRICRLGLLGSLVVEESPEGPGLNVRAATLDPITQQEVPLQVYWHLEEGSEEPVHMLVAGSASYPAHGGDPMRPELLAGFPRDSRPHILHAINHLHDLADLAIEIAMAKDADTVRMLGQEGMEGDAADIVMGQMQAESLEDTLAAMNGIARLYTGFHTDRDVRNS